MERKEGRVGKKWRGGERERERNTPSTQVIFAEVNPGALIPFLVLERTTNSSPGTCGVVWPILSQGTQTHHKAPKSPFFSFPLAAAPRVSVWLGATQRTSRKVTLRSHVHQPCLPASQPSSSGQEGDEHVTGLAGGC